MRHDAGGSMNQEGNTAGFHYGTVYAPCNGVLHWTSEVHEDGRQISVCDACGTKCVERPQSAEKIAQDNEIWAKVMREKYGNE
jgi:hypothetical protein